MWFLLITAKLVDLLSSRQDEIGNMFPGAVPVDSRKLIRNRHQISVFLRTVISYTSF